MASSERVIQKTDKMYRQLSDRMAAVEGELGHTVPGVGRTVNGMPVSMHARRPVIGADKMPEVPVQRESTEATARRLPGGVIRLAFSSPDAGSLYGLPLAIASNYGKALPKSDEPRNRSVGVDIAPGEDPKLIVETVNGTWDTLDDVRTVDAARVAGAITASLIQEERPVHAIEPIPEGHILATLQS